MAGHIPTIAPKGKIFGPILPMFILSKNISHGAKILYAILCNYAGEKDHCWPSQATLSKKIGCSISSIKNYLCELKNEHLIRVERESFSRSIYFILIFPDDAAGKRNETKMAVSPTESSEPKIGHRQPTFGYRNNSRNNRNSPPCSPQGKVHPATPTPQRNPLRGNGGEAFWDSDSAFEELYAAYPRKEAKEYARRIWHRLWRNGVIKSLSVIMAALEKFKASANWAREHGRYIPHLKNWLLGQRWLDVNMMDMAATPLHEDHEKIEHVQRCVQQVKERIDAQNRKILDSIDRAAFDEFLSRFENGQSYKGPAFGLWSLLFRKGKAPLAHDVKDPSMNIITFLRTYQH